MSASNINPCVAILTHRLYIEHFLGYQLAQLVEHVQRLCPRCSSHRFKSGQSLLLHATPLSHPISCHLSEAVLPLKPYKPQQQQKKIEFTS